MKKPKVDLRTGAERLENAVRIAGHADQCTELQLRKTEQDLSVLIALMYTLRRDIDKELTRQYNELVGTITNK